VVRYFAMVSDTALTMMSALMPQCVRVIMGGSHDSGYVDVLFQLQAQCAVRGKVKLLEGPPFVSEVQRVGDTTFFPRVKFGNLFSERSFKSSKTSKSAQITAESDAASPMSPNLTSPNPMRSSVARPAKLDTGILLLKLSDIAVFQSLKTLLPHACNLHYLSDQGCTKSDCQYSHSHKLNSDQLAALLFLSKTRPCALFQKYGNCVRGDACIQGHECTDYVNGTCEHGAKCKLSHPVGGMPS
jgi:hypothetical protein